MSTQTLFQELPMARKKAGRPVTSDRDDVVIKIDRIVAANLRYVADHQKQSLAEYVSELLRPISEKEVSRIRGEKR